MDIDKIINDLDIDIDAKNEGPGPEALPLEDLLRADILTDDIQLEIYNRFRAAAVAFIDEWVQGPACYDLKAQNMMYCSYDTWQACITDFGRSYFLKNKLLHDYKRERLEGGTRYRDDVMIIGLLVYEDLCSLYKKVFQIYAAALFLGVRAENMQRLNAAHGQWLKTAHGIQENSLRAGALNNRGSTVGYAMILNHDYNYTKTSEVIHTTARQELTASSLPQISGPAAGGDLM